MTRDNEYFKIYDFPKTIFKVEKKSKKKKRKKRIEEHGISCVEKHS